MSALEVDDRGILVACPNCGQRNRLAFDRSGRPGSLWEVQDGPEPTVDAARRRYLCRLRQTGCTSVPADRRGLLGAVVRTVPDGGARVGGTVAGGRPVDGSSSRSTPTCSAISVSGSDPLDSDDGGVCARTRSRPHGRCAAGGRHRSLRAAGAFSVRSHVIERPRVFALNLHANYACRHSGACCTAGWAIPVEADRQALLGGEMLLPDAHGACVVLRSDLEAVRRASRARREQTARCVFPLSPARAHRRSRRLRHPFALLSHGGRARRSSNSSSGDRRGVRRPFLPTDATKGSTVAAPGRPSSGPTSCSTRRATRGGSRSSSPHWATRVSRRQPRWPTSPTRRNRSGRGRPRTVRSKLPSAPCGPSRRRKRRFRNGTVGSRQLMRMTRFWSSFRRVSSIHR